MGKNNDSFRGTVVLFLLSKLCIQLVHLFTLTNTCASHLFMRKKLREGSPETVCLHMCIYLEVDFYLPSLIQSVSFIVPPKGRFIHYVGPLGSMLSSVFKVNFQVAVIQII